MKIITFHTPNGNKEIPCPYTEKKDIIEWLKQCFPFDCRYVNEKKI